MGGRSLAVYFPSGHGLSAVTLQLASLAADIGLALQTVLIAIEFLQFVFRYPGPEWLA